MNISKGEVGFEYWWRWQVPICALIIIIPAVVCFVLIKKKLKQDHELINGCLWLPCWRGLNPKWLLLYRIFALISMAWVLYEMIAFVGLLAFYFYTQWTFSLVTVYFAIATIISARECWLYSENDRTTKKQAGFLGYLMHTIYHVSAGASILTDIVFWCVLVPMLSGKEFQMTLLMGFVHSLNVIFLIIDSSLNNLPFEWFGFTYFALWTVLYAVFQWGLHAYGFTRWPYPFLELATPWAPLWYFALALVHIPCYCIYVILIKAMNAGFSRLFPRAYMRLDEEVLRGEKRA